MSTQIQITGATNFVDRMFEAAGPYQWVRELLQNSIEAQAHRVVFGVEWEAVKHLKTYRRIVSDDGQGMDRDELRTFFSTLGAGSKRIGGVDQNFGVGAKISLLPWNPAGVVVVSYKDGVGSMIQIVRKGQEYELVEFPDGKAKSTVVTPGKHDGIDWSKVAPDWGRKHGTHVVLLGDAREPNTALGHTRGGGKEIRGVSSYLNTRYWDLSGLDVHVHEFRSIKSLPKSASDTNDATRINRRRVLGAKSYAERGGAEAGTVALDGGRCTAHWYLGPKTRTAVHSYAKEGGYTAIRYRGELYQVTSAKPVWRWFGVAEAAVQQRLTIVLEPQVLTKGHGVYPDQSRNRLMFQGDGERGAEVPVAKWAYEFAENLPAAVRAAIREARGSDKPETGEISEEYRNRLAERFGQHWKLNTAVMGGKEDVLPAGRGNRGEAAGIIGKGTEDEGDAARKATPKDPDATEGTGEKGHHAPRSVDIPRYRLAHAVDFEQPWHLASWAPHAQGGPTVLLNVDSPILQQIVEYRQAMYPEVYGEEIADEVRRTYGEILACKVAHSQRLLAAVPEDVLDRDYRSERALTVALMGLIAEENLVAKKLSRKFKARA